MKRLQFRHQDNIFENRSLALDFFHSLTDTSHTASTVFGTSLYAEPMVARYKDIDGNIQILFALGAGSPNVPYHIIDTKAILEQINENKTTLDNEILRSISEDAIINNKIDSEKLRAQEEEQKLNTRIDENLTSIVSVEPSSSNILEEYALKNSNNELLGEHIKVYKDSSLVGALTGFKGAKSVSKNDDNTFTLTYDESTRDESIEFLYLVYRDESGELKLVGIDFENFLMEAEFGDGFSVVNHIASIKIKEGEKYLNVTNDGISTVNITETIENAVETNQASIVEVKEGLPSNIKTRYILKNNKDTQLGASIDFLIESALISVKQGKKGDVIDTQTGNYISYGNGDTTINFIYRLENGTYELLQVVVSEYFTDAHFGRGLNNQDGVISLLEGDGNEYLIISEDSISVVGVNEAIYNAKEESRAYTDLKVKTDIDIASESTKNYIDLESERAIAAEAVLHDRINNIEKIAEKSAEEVAKEEVAKIVAGAPENLNTLKEIADYIASDAENAAQISNDINSLKAISADTRLVTIEEDMLYIPEGETEPVKLKEYIKTLEQKVFEIENKSISEEYVRTIIKEYLTGVANEISVKEENDLLHIGFADDAIFGYFSNDKQ